VLCGWLTAAYDNWFIIFRHRMIMTLSYIIGCYCTVGNYDITLSVTGCCYITGNYYIIGYYT